MKVFITGGARSGKSRFAEEILKNEDRIIYIATGIAFDKEMRDRIGRHKESRNKNWITIEAYKDFNRLLKDKLHDRDHILLDCVTIMVSNLMLMDNDIDWDDPGSGTIEMIEKTVQEEINGFLKIADDFPGKTVIVSNELGMGIVPTSPLGRYFRDIAGRMNQIIAQASDEVYFMVSGIPVKIKG